MACVSRTSTRPTCEPGMPASVVMAVMISCARMPSFSPRLTKSFCIGPACAADAVGRDGRCCSSMRSAAAAISMPSNSASSGSRAEHFAADVARGEDITQRRTQRSVLATRALRRLDERHGCHRAAAEQRAQARDLRRLHKRVELAGPVPTIARVSSRVAGSSRARWDRCSRVTGAAAIIRTASPG